MKKSLILLVDDEPRNHRLMQVALHKQYNLKFAINGLEAMQILDELDPDLILMDINMPGQNGFSLCEQIRRKLNLMLLPVLFISAEDTVQMRISAYKSGGNDYLCKPVVIAELISKIEVLLENSLKYREMRGSLVDSRKIVLSSASLNAEQTAILNFIDTSFNCRNTEELADAFFILTATFGLQASIQFSQSKKLETFSSLGAALPIEVQILEHPEETKPHKLGKELTSVQGVTVLVGDFPDGDNVFSDRIRNYINLALKACEARIKTL